MLCNVIFLCKIYNPFFEGRDIIVKISSENDSAVKIEIESEN